MLNIWISNYYDSNKNKIIIKLNIKLIECYEQNNFHIIKAYVKIKMEYIYFSTINYNL